DLFGGAESARDRPWAAVGLAWSESPTGTGQGADHFIRRSPSRRPGSELPVIARCPLSARLGFRARILPGYSITTLGEVRADGRVPSGADTPARRTPPRPR